MDHRPARQPTRRIILLGASNLLLSFPLVVEIARRIWGGPLEIMAAMGHGRSYGQDSRVLGRKISGIFHCALWQDLQSSSPLPAAALVTDVGNDLLYGVPPDRLADWVAGCVDRLAESGTMTILTELPMASIARLGEARFQFFRRLFFPRCTLTRSAVCEAATALNALLIALAKQRNIPIIPVSSAWYGFDPIHLKRRARCRAWPELLGPWCAIEPTVGNARASVWTSAYLACLAPCEQSLLGVRVGSRQPTGRLRDGTTVSLY